ncbi:hypothetical protein CK203_041561 [Vitis vinifera]|uniref:Uncharacterized protein n=1 Tax=Vitis vinifera TaxID=29760 RepID=A0A438I7G8_VITVI|nr:hypothetical protein CK203_041561 [Vitis vinifera]
MKIPSSAAKAPFHRVFHSCETNFGTRVPFRSTVTPISKRKHHSNRLFTPVPKPDDVRTSDHLLRSSLPDKFRQSDMARTRGAKSSSPSSRKRVPREAPVQGPTFEPPRSKAASPSTNPAPQKPPTRRYLTRSGGRPLQKRARVESSKPIDLTEQSSVPSPEPSPAPSSAPSSEPPMELYEHQPPLSES